MTIVNELQRIENNIKASYTALADKGATLPTKQNSDNLASTITNLEVGGGGNDEILKGIIEGTVTDIEMPNSVESIAMGFFRNDRSASPYYNVDINSIKANGVTEVGTYCFYWQTFKKIELQNLQVVNSYAFGINASSSSKYSVLEKIKLGKLTNIGNYAFSGLFKFSSSATPEVDMSFDNCTIGDYAFEYYNYPSFDATNVTKIGKTIFKNAYSNFKKVWLPSTITTISTNSSTPMFSFAQAGTVTIYTDATEDNIPSGWATGWNTKSGSTGTVNVVYGATYEDFLNAEV